MNAPPAYLKQSFATTAIIATLGLALPWWRLETYTRAQQQGRVPNSKFLELAMLLPVAGTLLLTRLLEHAAKKHSRRSRLPRARFATAVLALAELAWLYVVLRGAVPALWNHWRELLSTDTWSEFGAVLVPLMSLLLLIAAIEAAAVVRIGCAWRTLEPECTLLCYNLPLQLVAACAGAIVTIQLVGHHADGAMTAVALVATWFAYADAVRVDERPPQPWTKLFSGRFAVHAIGVQAWAFTALALFVVALALTGWVTFQEQSSGEHPRLYEIALLERPPDHGPTHSTYDANHRVAVSLTTDSPGSKKYSVLLRFNFKFSSVTNVKVLLTDDSGERPVCRVGEDIVPTERFHNYIASGFASTFEITQEVVDRPTQQAFTCQFAPRYAFARLASFSARTFDMRVLALHGASNGPPGDFVNEGILLPFVADFRAFRRGEPIVVTGGRWSEDDRLRKLTLPAGWIQEDDSAVTVRWDDPAFVQTRDAVIIIIGALYALMAAAVLEWLRSSFAAAASDASAQAIVHADELRNSDEG
jgi:hypothetical protein